jgi:hypothetical protein
MKDRTLLVLGVLAVWAFHQTAEVQAAPNPPPSSFASRQTRALEEIATQLKKLNTEMGKCRR